jgi:hypothetical protein
MANGISAGRIEAVQRHIYDALTQSSDGSTLPLEEQDRLLAQACVEVCDLLARWRDSPEWEELGPVGHAPIAEAIPEWERIRPFLDPLRETLAAIAQRQRDLPILREIGDPDQYIDTILASARKTARRFRGYERQDLFAEASKRMERLRGDVCGLAAEFKDDLASQAKTAEKRTKWRNRARWVLRKIPSLLLTLSLAAAGTSPATMRQNIPEWGHEAVKVLVVHHVAETAQPGVSLAPPRLGPQLH